MENTPEDTNEGESIEKEGEPLSPEEKAEWLDGMEEYGGQLEEEIQRLKDEIDGAEDNEEKRSAEVLIYDLEQEVKGMKEFVDEGRGGEDLYKEE